MEELIGRTIQNYKIVSTLGKGGMGVVYKAYDTHLERNVAIKMLLPQVLDKKVIIERFKREAKNQAKFSHPNIVTVYGLINYESQLGIVMEYVEGESIEKIIFRQKRLHLFDAVYIMKQTLAGIGYAHAKGFIHRDIKPSNILLSKEGEVKIMDFGISKSLLDKGMTKTGAKVGTVYYMSPEQIRGQKITHHVDLYSVGCTFYEMITGQPPFDLDSEYEVMDAHLKREPDKISSIIPGTPLILDQIISRSLKKDPAERYQSADEFLKDIIELEKYLKSINAETQLKIKKKTKTSTALSVFAFSSMILLFIALAYFAFVKVDELIKSDRIRQIEKFDVQTLFKNEAKFNKLSAVNLPEGDEVNSVSFLKNGVGFAAGNSGKIWVSDNSGESWNAYQTETSVNLRDAYLFVNGKCFAVGDSSTILAGDNYFNKMHKIYLPGNYSLFKIDFVDELTGYISGSGGLILKSTDGGNSWRQKVSDTKNTIFDFDFLSPTEAVAVGWNGVILKTTDAGERWTSVPPVTEKYLKSVDFYDDSFGIAVGGAEILITNDGGDSWNLVETPENIYGMQDVLFTNDEIIFICGKKGIMLVSKNGGSNWSEIKTGTFMNLNKLGKLNNSVIFAAGHGKLIKIH